MKIELNQILTRMLGGQIAMEVFVESIDKTSDTFMVSKKGSIVPKGHGWTFCRKTGAEIDDDLKWGPRYGTTGSYIKEIVDEKT